MVKKFQSLFGERTAWRSLFRTALLTALLFWVKSSGFGFWPVVLFFLGALAIYFLLLPERKTLRFSFWFLVFGAFLGLLYVPFEPFQVLALVIFAVLLFLILGQGFFLFGNRFLVHDILNTGLLFLLFLPVFYLAKPESLFFWLIVYFCLLTLMFGEYFRFFGVSGRRCLTFALILGFLGVEFVSVIVFLPLGFVNAAAFMVLILLLMRDGALIYFRGGLDLSFLFRELVFFVFFTVLIFATAKWTI